MDQRSGIPSGRRSGIVSGGYRLLDVDAITRVLLISSVMLVMIVEILNSAIEAVVDRIGSEYHELSGRAKDMGSAAVLIAIIVAVITWCILLWSHFG